MAIYNVILKNQKTRQYDRMALFILILNIAVMILAAIYTSDKDIRTKCFVGAASGIICLALDRFLSRTKNNAQKFYKQIAFLSLTACWIAAGNWWAGALCFMLSILFQISQRNLSVSVDDKNVLYPSFPRKTIAWSDLNNLILKDGLLTVDFRNNKIFQSEIESSPAEINEKEFNDFCIKQLTRSRKAVIA